MVWEQGRAFSSLRNNVSGCYRCKVEITGPLLHESPEVDQHSIRHVGNIDVMITTLHLE